MVMTVVMVMRGRGKRWCGEHHDEKYGSENLLHKADSSMMRIVESCMHRR